MRHSLIKRMDVPSPVGQGWHLVGKQLNIKWITKDPAPGDVLKAVYCSCKSNKCETGRCSCIDAKLSCTDFCKCSDCKNVNQIEDIIVPEDESDVSDSK